MCRHSYEYPGRRSYGGFVPGYAQGAYFPGDEPGARCALTGEACTDPLGDRPTECAANSPTQELCPQCRAEGCASPLWKLGESGTCVCLECAGEWTAQAPLTFSAKGIWTTRNPESLLCVVFRGYLNP